MSTCLYPRRDETTACGYAHTTPCPHCGTTIDNHPSYCPFQDDNYGQEQSDGE